MKTYAAHHKAFATVGFGGIASAAADIDELMRNVERKADRHAAKRNAEERRGRKNFRQVAK